MAAPRRKIAAEFLRFLSKRSDHLREARTDINSFIEYVFVDPAGKSFVQGRMQREWQGLVDRYPFLVILAPRGHSKTSEITIARPLWHLGHEVNERIKILCQADKKAVKRLNAIRDNIQHNDSLHRVFPHLCEDRMEEWNKHMVKLERPLKSMEPSIEALGITSGGSGDRATKIYFDDIVDRRNAITLPKVRTQIIEAWPDWINLLMPGGRIVYLATLWHRSDNTHQLLKQPDVYPVAWYELDTTTLKSYVKLPDGTERHSDKPLWGEDDGGPWTIDALKIRRAQIGPRKFARGFGMRPMVDEEQRVRPEWVTYWDEPQCDGVPPIKGEDAWPVTLWIDTATTTGTKSDWTGVAILAVRPDIWADEEDIDDLSGAIKCIDAFHVKLTFPERVRLVWNLVRRYRPKVFGIERTNDGLGLAEQLLDKYGIAAVLPRPKGKKGSRLDRITPYLAGAQVEFNPQLNPLGGLVNDERGDLVAELTGFPLTEHDDILDAFVHGVRWITATRDAFVADEAALADADGESGDEARVYLV